MITELMKWRFLIKKLSFSRMSFRNILYSGSRWTKCSQAYPVFSSVLDVEPVLSDVPQVEVASDVEAADDVVDDDVDLFFVVGRHLTTSFAATAKKPDTEIFKPS